MPNVLSGGPMRLALMLSAVTLILSGCATTTGSGATSTPPPAAETYCQIAKPITWSSRDTDDTIRQVKEHNAVYLRLCGGDR